MNETPPMDTAAAAREPVRRLERRLRLAAIVVAAGLLVALLCLPFVHPLAFLAFVILGCGLAFVGIAIYLVALVW